MNKNNADFPVRKQFIEVPLPMPCSFFYKVWMYLKGIMLSPIYLLMAYIAGAPGIGIRMRCAATGINLLLKGRASLKICYRCILFPMDSTRYFEFHEVWKSVKGFAFTRYLDISSPRLMTLLLLKSAPEATAVLINPDHNDLQETEQLASVLRLKSRCEFINVIIDNNTGFTPASFDLITCLSVLEHIPEDKAAVGAMWSLLRPGGKLILSLPCMSQPLEQYISHNPYGVLRSGDDGYTFWQRYYDRNRLESSIYSVAGQPTRIAVYGEIKRGLFFRNATIKRLMGSFYTFWREPYMMATEYRSFSSTDVLPGEGVVMLEFTKSGERE